MSNMPFTYNQTMVYDAIVSPSTVHVKNNALRRFFYKYLLDRAISVFKFNIPKHWSKRYFLYYLFCAGNISIIRTSKYGIIPQGGTLSGYNVFYDPNIYVINNPLLGSKELRIWVDCGLIMLKLDYTGITDIVSYYADMMALTAESFGVNQLNSHFVYLFAAQNKAASESYKKAYDDFASGEPAVCIDKNLVDSEGNLQVHLFQNNVKENYIAGELLSDLRKLENMFDTEIGIPNANVDKKERMITDEVNVNNVETTILASLWLENLKETIDKTNDLFGEQILSVDWRYNPEGGNIDESET